MLKVHSIETFGTHDGPGIRLVIFLQGCLMRCAYCHNPDSQEVNALTAKDISAKKVLELLEKQKPYFGVKGGVTFSGGEPTVQAKELLPVIKEVTEAGFHTALDTCGAIYSPGVNELYDAFDLIILDVKHIDPEWHKKLTRVSNENALKNAEYREKSGKKLWLRYVLVPGWTDQPEFLEQWAKHFSSFTQVERVEILPYHTLGVHKYKQMDRPYMLEHVKPPTPDQVDQAKAIFDKYLKNVVVA